MCLGIGYGRNVKEEGLNKSGMRDQGGQNTSITDLKARGHQESERKKSGSGS